MLKTKQFNEKHYVKPFLKTLKFNFFLHRAHDFCENDKIFHVIDLYNDANVKIIQEDKKQKLKLK